MGLHYLRRFQDILWPSFAFTRAILGSLCIHWGMLMVVGLKLENVSVPPTGLLKGSVNLVCEYSLGSDALLSLKWYRDGHEFFRFSPGNKDANQITTFDSPGIQIDRGESLKLKPNGVKFRLTNLSLESKGTYRCEISAEAPSFQTLHNEGNLSIIALPKSPKAVLSGFPTLVQFGEKINGNCTFSDTFPAAELTLYLNNIKMNQTSETELHRYEPVKVGERLTSVLGVKFRASPKYFQSGILQIRCESRLFDQRWETLRNITHQNHQQFLTAGQNQYSSGEGGGTNVANVCIPSWIASRKMISIIAVLHLFSRTGIYGDSNVT